MKRKQDMWGFQGGILRVIPLTFGRHPRGPAGVAGGGGVPFDPHNLVFLLQFGPRSNVRSSQGQHETKTGDVGFLEGSSSRKFSCFRWCPTGVRDSAKNSPLKIPHVLFSFHFGPRSIATLSVGQIAMKNGDFGGQRGPPRSQATARVSRSR